MVSTRILQLLKQLNHSGRHFNLFQSSILGLIAGLFGGLMAMAYYQLLKLAVRLVWTDLFFKLKDLGLFHSGFVEYNFIWMGSLGFIFLHVVFLFLFRKKAFGNLELVVEQLHHDAKVPLEYFLPMLLTSLVCLSSGSGLSQESPIVVLSAVMSSYIGQQLRLEGPALRIFVLAGVSAAMSGYFGSPLTGLFALEMLHRIGFEFFEAFPAVMIASFLGSVIMQAILWAPFGSFFIFRDALTTVSVIHVFQGLFLAVVGALVGSAFVLMTQFYNFVHRRLNLGSWKILLPFLGWILFSGIGVMLPLVLFWGHPELQSVVDLGVRGAESEDHWKGDISGVFGVPIPFSVGIVFAIGITKLILLPLLFALNLKGGMVFAMFSIGGIFGQGVSMLTGMDQSLCVTAVMAATQSVVTRTPLSSSLVCLFSSKDLAPQLLIPLFVASFVANLLTLKVVMVPSQKPRGDIAFLQETGDGNLLNPVASSSPGHHEETHELLERRDEEHRQ